MVLFHQTLNDALKSLKNNDAKSALDILSEHREAELSEENYIKTSLYAIRQYLQNYMNRIDQAIEILSKQNISADERKLAMEHIERCIDNMKEFEEGTKGLLKREGALLE
jgi:small-conductance mechanosensitive channel